MALVLTVSVARWCELRDWQNSQVQRLRNTWATQEPQPAVVKKRAGTTRRSRVGAGWTVAGIRDWCRKEANVRPAAVADALTELANLIEEDTL